MPLVGSCKGCDRVLPILLSILLPIADSCKSCDMLLPIDGSIEGWCRVLPLPIPTADSCTSCGRVLPILLPTVIPVAHSCEG